MILIIDNGSRAISNIKEFLDGLGEQYMIHDFKDIQDCRYDGVMITGTQINPENEEVYKEEIRFMQECTKPMLAICGAHQLLSIAYGGSINRCEPVMGKQEIKIRSDDIFVQGLDKTAFVLQKHTWEVSCLPNDFVCIADSDTCRFEIIKHIKRPLYGVQFHPERRNDGTKILINFMRVVDEHKRTK